MKEVCRMEEIKRVIADYYNRNIDKNLSVSDEFASIINEYSSKTDMQAETIYEISKLCEKKFENKKEKGAFFTPYYISSYIAKKIEPGECKVIDPACGCGNILIAAIDRIARINEITPLEATEYIYGIDIDEKNIYYAKILIELWCLEQGCDTDGINFNIKCADSLTSDWFNLEYDYIIGNPPYVNYRQINKAKKEIYSSMYLSANGMYNLSHVFIEKAVSKLAPNGKMVFITINNILYSEGSAKLRKLIDSKGIYREIIDLGETPVFAVKVKTCILTVENKNDNRLMYTKSSYGDNPESFLTQINLQPCSSWMGNTEQNSELINSICSHPFKLKGYVKGSIATLKDDVFIVNDDKGVKIDGSNFKLEEDVIKKVYMGSKMITKNIIYPYYPDGKIIPEQELAQNFPNTYKYLLSRKSELETRDNGKPNPVSWYAYGRVQGIPLYNKVLIAGTYNKEPNFYKPAHQDALVHGGVAISADIPINPDILFIIMNSDVMRFYIMNVEYSLVGEYWAYNTKKLKKFSIPELTEKDEEYLLSHTKEETDRYLWKLYIGKGEV